MNEQDKRELMLKAAAQFKGVWPSEYCDMLALCGGGREEILASKSDGLGRVEVFDSLGLCIGRVDVDCVFCVRSEYEAFIDSLFEGAPDDATHYRVEDNTFIKCDSGWYKYQDGKWIGYFGGLSPNCVDSLIPRPRKRESTIDFSLGGVIEDEYKAKIKELQDRVESHVDGRIAEINIDGHLELLGVLNREKVIELESAKNPEVTKIKGWISEPNEWNGEGLPHVGVECECFMALDHNPRLDEWVWCIIVGRLTNGAIVIELNDGTFESVYEKSKFRPLKTEAEKERERLFKAAFDALNTDGMTYYDIDIFGDFVSALIDAGVIK